MSSGVLRLGCNTFQLSLANCNMYRCGQLQRDNTYAQSRNHIVRPVLSNWMGPRSSLVVTCTGVHLHRRRRCMLQGRSRAFTRVLGAAILPGLSNHQHRRILYAADDTGCQIVEKFACAREFAQLVLEKSDWPSSDDTFFRTDDVFL